MPAPSWGSDRPRLCYVVHPRETNSGAFDPETFDFGALDPADFPVGRMVELADHPDVTLTRGPGPDEWIVTSYVGSLPEGSEPVPVLPFSRMKLENEYSCTFPLWMYDANGDGPFFEESAVSPALAAKLTEWAATFTGHFDEEAGWRLPEEAVRAHREAGFALERELRDELGPEIKLEVSFWETDALGR